MPIRVPFHFCRSWKVQRSLQDFCEWSFSTITCETILLMKQIKNFILTSNLSVICSHFSTRFHVNQSYRPIEIWETMKASSFDILLELYVTKRYSFDYDCIHSHIFFDCKLIHNPSNTIYWVGLCLRVRIFPFPDCPHSIILIYHTNAIHFTK